MTRVYNNPLFQVVILLVVGAGVIVFVSFVSDRYKEPEVIERVIEKTVVAPECPLDFPSYGELTTKGQVVELVTNYNAFAQNGRFVNEKTLTVTRSGESEIVCGYLYVLAHVDKRGLHDKYESVYINPQGFGGHILRSRGVKFGQNNTSSTELLLSLNAISYLPNVPYNPNATDYRVSDWVKLLAVSDQVQFEIALSAQDSKAQIDSIKIAYKCWDKTTGKETNGCQLGVK